MNITVKNIPEPILSGDETRGEKAEAEPQFRDHSSVGNGGRRGGAAAATDQSAEGTGPVCGVPAASGRQCAPDSRGPGAIASCRRNSFWTVASPQNGCYPSRTARRRLDGFERWASGEVRLIAPDLLLAEFASLIAKRNRRKEISAEQAQAAFRLMAKCAPRLFDTRPQLPRALDLSLQYQLSLGDCVYLALALEHDCPVLTADRRLFPSWEGQTPFRAPGSMRDLGCRGDEDSRSNLPERRIV